MISLSKIFEKFGPKRVAVVNPEKKEVPQIESEVHKAEITALFNEIVLSKRKITEFDPNKTSELVDAILDEYLHYYQMYHLFDYKGYVKPVDISQERIREILRHNVKRAKFTNELLENAYGLTEIDLMFLIFKSVMDRIKADGKDYYEYGFTPQISKKYLGINCLGFVQVLAAMLLKAGFIPKLAIGVNHPFLIVSVKEEVFMLSLYGVSSFPVNLIKEDQEIQVLDFNKIPKGSQLDMETSDEKLLVVCDFKQSILYEILESFRAFQAIAKGEDVRGIGMTDIEMRKRFLKRIGEYLKGIDFSKLQLELFPKLAETFQRLESRMAEEHRSLEGVYKKRDAAKFLLKVLDVYCNRKNQKILNGEQITFGEHEKFNKSELENLKAYRELYPKEIADFLEFEKQFSVNVPYFVQDSYISLKKLIYEIEDEALRLAVLLRLISPIRDLTF